MRLWRVIVLLNLALGIGLLLGYVAWGRQIPRLQKDLELARQRISVQSLDQTWTVQGVVRAVIPEINVLVITHEELQGFMPSMTMGFRVQDSRLYQNIEVGDAIRFTLKGAPPNVLITEITKQGKS